MRRFKHFIILTVSLCIISLFLIGCQGTGPGGTTETGGSDSGKVTLDFWTPQWGDAEAEWFEKWIEEYNDSQDEVEVKVEFVPGDAWEQKVTAAQAAGTGPDITTMNYNKIVFFSGSRNNSSVG